MALNDSQRTQTAMLQHFRVPGRIELVGKHVDYAGGRSLTCAVDLAITATARPLAIPVLRVQDSQRAEIVERPLNAACTAPTGHWTAYAAAVTRRLCRDFPEMRTGVDLRLHSTLPESAGLSSSSAFVVAVATALVEANALATTPCWQQAVPTLLARAEYFGAMETGAAFGPFNGDTGVGVRGGAQDHVAILCARADQCGVFRYRPAAAEQYVDWPRDYMLAVAVSGVEATKTGNARARYNRVSDALRELAKAAAGGEASNGSGNEGTTAKATVADLLAQGGLDRLTALASAGLPGFAADYLLPRLEQFCEEVEQVVPSAAAALAARNLDSFGQWVDRSQALAESSLGNQVPETTTLQRLARELGATAASAFGAGFGGAVWAMVPAAEAERFQAHWAERYLAAFPAQAPRFRSFITRPGPGLMALHSTP